MESDLRVSPYAVLRRRCWNWPMTNGVEQELQAATDRILQSDSRKKLTVAGPGTGKTFIFRRLLEQCAGQPDERLVLTFINNLKDDIERSVWHLAQVSTLHGYC